MEGVAAQVNLLSDAPGFDQIVKAVESVGFPIVIAILILLLVVTPMFFLARSIVSNLGERTDSLGNQVSGAVTLFSDTLSRISTRQEQSSDKLAEVLTEQGKLIAQMNESIRIQLNFTTQQMAQQAALTQQVANVAHNTAPETLGVIKPVEDKPAERQEQ